MAADPNIRADSDRLAEFNATAPRIWVVGMVSGVNLYAWPYLRVGADRDFTHVQQHAAVIQKDVVCYEDVVAIIDIKGCAQRRLRTNDSEMVFEQLVADGNIVVIGLVVVSHEMLRCAPVCPQFGI